MHIRSLKSHLIISCFLAVTLYILNANIFFVSANTFNPYNSALAYMARAETAQTPNEVIEHVTMAKIELTTSGYVSWWPVTENEIKSIQDELDDLIFHANSISSLESPDDLYLSEMSYIHGRLRAIQEDLLAF